MIGKFAAYDFIANLIPGLAFLWALGWLAQFFGDKNVIPVSGSIGNTAALIAWAYIAGLLIQGVAQGVVERIVLAAAGGFPSARWLCDGGDGFTDEHRKRLKGAIRDYFGEPVEPVLPKDTDGISARKASLRRYQELFYLCYNLVDENKLSERPLTFNAQYGLFRALLTFSLILSCVYGFVLVFAWKEIAQHGSLDTFFFIILFFLLAALISHSRMIKRGEDFAKSIYDLFYAFYRQEKATKR